MIFYIAAKFCFNNKSFLSRMAWLNVCTDDFSHYLTDTFNAVSCCDQTIFDTFQKSMLIIRGYVRTVFNSFDDIFSTSFTILNWFVGGCLKFAFNQINFSCTNWL